VAADGRRERLEMRINDLAENMALIVPMLLLLEALVAIIVWFAYGSKGGRAARIAAWLGLTTLTFWVGSGIAFVGLNLVYFSLGSTATIIAAIFVTVFMVAMPFGWAYVVRHHGRDETGPQPR
jgi:hypothetical protein